jgi:hypothetical protein
MDRPHFKKDPEAPPVPRGLLPLFLRTHHQRAKYTHQQSTPQAHIFFPSSSLQTTHNYSRSEPRPPCPSSSSQILHSVCSAIFGHFFPGHPQTLSLIIFDSRHIQPRLIVSSPPYHHHLTTYATSNPHYRPIKMPASQEVFTATPVDLPMSPPPPSDLAQYARSMHSHTKRLMELAAISTTTPAPVPGRSNTGSSTSSENDNPQFHA